MMILDVKKLNGLKEYTGTAEFTFEPEAALIDIPYVSFDGNAVARISYEIFEDGAVEVKGDVSYRLKGLCSRCLKETATDVKSCVDAVYLTEDNGEDYAYDGNKIDLSELFKDTIVFGMPGALSGGDGCKGVPDGTEALISDDEGVEKAD